MIVSARIFLILLVPLLLATTPYGYDPPIHGGNPSASPPAPSEELPSEAQFPWYDAADQPANANQLAPVAPESTSADGLPAHTNIDGYEDLTDRFVDPRLLSPSACELPSGTWYRLAGAYDRIPFNTLPEGAIVRSDAIAVTEKGYLVLLRAGTRVTIFEPQPDDLYIRVPAFKMIRVVNVPLEKQNRIWKNCVEFFNAQCAAIRAPRPKRRAEKRNRYMKRCFHYEMLRVGDDFHGIPVKHYKVPADNPRRGRGRGRPRSGRPRAV